ncbi:MULTISPECIES: hypothetical protein [Pseudomonas fluorescens group]|jgi:hypothetical protein|uniref:Uncharacterized protein n=1 Tax=Pseudomonas fluorescens TaxID=294 RepID=A0ACD4Y0C9_PSEFL|nr:MULTISPECIES: hypothetical protein [Pseudomonas fluorescens group]MBZ6459255.1 hypothetical protein [Pseudomonas fluorescens group sp.]MBZ6465406.1 hypothetical protein [Pseudomonas fluorescens group sp.]MBZ6471407.1 hypothetical protein [Pseudomonas fluorescens group sp.]WPN26147.1 hypothetical protein QMK57_12610 [Pseudomonas marginalis]WQD74827.1 hypothetical protein U0037_13060 [Pseudomonas marginalis]
MQRAKVQVADGLNGGYEIIRRRMRGLFTGSIAQGMAGLDEMFESFATDLCSWQR